KCECAASAGLRPGAQPYRTYPYCRERGGVREYLALRSCNTGFPFRGPLPRNTPTRERFVQFLRKSAAMDAGNQLDELRPGVKSLRALVRAPLRRSKPRLMCAAI